MLGKALLATLYLKLTLYIITNLVSVYNLQKILCLKWNNFVWIFIFSSIPLTLKTYLSWTTEWTCICFLGDLHKLFFFYQIPLFHHYWWWEREKNQFFKYFFKILPKFDKKILEIHEQSWLWITWILKKLDSIQTLVEDIPKIKLSHWSLQSKTYTFNNSNSYCLEQILCFILIITLSLLRFWVIKSQL